MRNFTILKRAVAYIIDFLVITILSMAITKMSFINPNSKAYEATNAKYTAIVNSYLESEINIEEYTSKVNDLSYEMNKYGAIFIGLEMIITLAYFGGFAYYTKGQTLGKKVMNLKIVSSEKTEVKLWEYLIRAVIIDGILNNFITLVAVLFTKNIYYNIMNVYGYIELIGGLVIFFMIIFTKEGRGLHDYIAKTKVIDLKNTSTDNIPEAEIKEKDQESE